MTAPMPYNASISRRDTWILAGFRAAAVVQILTISFSIALSSLAFGVACVLYLYLLIVRRSPVYQTTDLEFYFLAYIVAVALMCVFAIHAGDALFNSRRVLLIAGVYFIPVVGTDERKLLLLLLLLGGFTALQSMLEIVVYVMRGDGRLGMFQNYMTAGGMKMIILLLLLPQLLRRRMRTRDRLLTAGFSLIIFLALILTETRSSWLGFIAGAVVVCLITYRRLLIPFAALVMILALLLPGRLQERIRFMFSTEQSAGSPSTVQSNINRLNMWKTGWRMFLDRPVFGVGDGHVWHIYRVYTTPHDNDEGGHLHNNYIHLLATHGIVGLATVLLLFYRIIATEWKTYRARGNAFGGHLALGALAAFTGFFINGFAEYNFGDHEILVYLWMTVGMAIAAARLPGEAS